MALIHFLKKVLFSHKFGERPPNPSPRRGLRCVGLIVAFLLGLCGCAAGGGTPGNPLPEHSGNFDTSATISYKDLKATATITQETPKACAVTFTSPPSLTDMSFVFQGETVELGYKGVSFTFDPATLPGGAVAGMTVSAINKAMKDDGISVDYTAGVLTLNGVMESGEFSLRLDAENGNLLKLSVPAEELEIEFVNFTFLE